MNPILLAQRQTRSHVQYNKRGHKSSEEGRNRSPNFTLNEKILLIKLVNAFPEATTTCLNTEANEAKKQVWDQIAEAFNELSSFHYRKVKVLRNLFFTLKKKQKTEGLEDINVTPPRGEIEQDHVGSNLNSSEFCDQDLSDHTEPINDTLIEPTWYPDAAESTCHHAKQYYQLRIENEHKLFALKEQCLMLKQKKERVKISLLEMQFKKEGGSD